METVQLQALVVVVSAMNPRVLCPASGSELDDTDGCLTIVRSEAKTTALRRAAGTDHGISAALRPVTVVSTMELRKCFPNTRATAERHPMHAQQFPEASQDCTETRRRERKRELCSITAHHDSLNNGTRELSSQHPSQS